MPPRSAPRFLGCLGDGADCEHLGEVRPVLARGVDVGRRVEVGAAHGGAHRVGVGRVGLQQHRARRRRSRSRRARRRSGCAADVDDAGALDAERDRGEAVLLAGRHRDLREQLAGADGRHVDAEEEVVGRAPRARRRRRRSSSAPASATISGGRWLVGSFEQMLPPSVPRFRTWTSAICAQTSPRIGRARASGSTHQLGVGRHRADRRASRRRRARCPSAPRAATDRRARRATRPAPSSR